MSDLSTVRFAALQQFHQLLDCMDQKLLEAARRGFRVAPVTSVGNKNLALKSSQNPLLIPLDFCPFHLILRYQCDRTLMNSLVLVLTVLGFTRGWRAAMMLRKRWQPPHSSAEEGMKFLCLLHICKILSFLIHCFLSNLMQFQKP